MSKAIRNGPASQPDPMSDHERIDWLLEFLRLDIQHLRDGEMLDLRTDVTNFCLSSGRIAAIIPSDSERDQKASAFLWAEEEGPEQLLPVGSVGAGWNLIWRIQLMVEVGIRNLEDSHENPKGILASTGHVWKPFGTGDAPTWQLELRDDGTVSRRYVAPLRQAFVAVAADLIQEYWPLLRRCKDEPCGTLFLPSHGAQNYHEPACSQRTRSKKFEPKRKLKKRDNHEEYKKGYRGPGTPRRRSKPKAKKKGTE